MNESNRFIEEFCHEAEELLSGVEDAVLDIEENPGDPEAVNRLFRAMHTIKGSGAMFGFDAISEFTHHVETALDHVRSGTIPVTKTLIDLILVSRDRITAMLAEANSGGPPVDPGEGEQIIASLKALLSSHGGETSAEDISKTASKQEARHDIKDELGQAAVPAKPELQNEAIYRIRFSPGSDIFSTGMDPVMLLYDLADMGESRVVAQTEKVPDLEHLSAESCYLSWDIILTTTESANSIRDVFIFVEDGAKIEIETVEEKVISSEDVPAPRLGDILVERGDIDRKTIDEESDTQKKIGERLVESGALSRQKLKSALEEQKVVSKMQKSSVASTVRVPSDRLDKLINLVGELVITQARLTQVASNRDDTDLGESVEEIERLTGELRDSVLNIRMMPIGTTFNKFRRLVRDLSSQLNKEIDLITRGAETELDKIVLERLDDPLVHLIRNSLDHGVEPPEIRKERGKPPKGTIILSASHKGTNVVITIEDDGAGLNVDIIRKKAVERGLIPENAELSDKKIFAQIFAPGFSTSKEVTNLSGRGVGMDVVKRTIESLRGRIDIDSIPGKGTKVTLILPLTLAIINGLLVTIDDDFFVLPLMSVEECVEIKSREIEIISGRNILNVRGEMVPYIRLRDRFRMGDRRPDVEHIVIADVNNSRIGFVVDHVIGGHQTVIKPLGPAFKGIKDISGATILGNGTVALILDTNVLLESA
ncbi:chemotaxis protein CheA [uncultured Desulfobacter sp.]|uniref:chemotaxis protein CheA n=1 Tax=uncultured Desulfobacter sp. TaxID=240139 RepID=UPI002AAC24AF|nr:chemotaxis protein CheA [uncultured Desulfobacter sp.]